MIARLALLVGFFGVPLLLLALGHRLRDRSPVQRGAFWGGVVGHTATLLVSVVALHYPPVLWTSEPRIALAFAAALIGGVVGAAIGAWRGTPSATS